MNAIDPAIAQVLNAQQAALKTRVNYALKAKQLDVERFKGEAITQMVQAAGRQAKQPGLGRLFDGVV